ncbi:MAG: nucleotidyl transferase AbiEii/AbiGii toxin family protein [Deltaproteobacteria bacterium]|nr:nucleotidyl transferase AbiEii/AbiGii toxin family protein [Deltaproteobacteria bacterium]
MASRGIDRRVVPEPAVRLVAACQARAPCRLAGGAALGGVYLNHRLSADLDLAFPAAEAVRELVARLPEVARECAVGLTVVQDGGTFVRARLDRLPGIVRLDLAFDPTPDLEPPPPPVDGLVVQSLADLRASKVTCLLSRTEPRDLVDLLFLERAGFPLERDLGAALRKDAGIDPGVLAWLLREFPLRPLPTMLQPLDATELERFRDALRERLRALAVP